ncbi:MAG: EF-hand domain-containing protein [Acidobacteria bacterium]|nr:EF-hand domain-containing protein [Acidobacteriota bacterium]MCB9398964.1 EF-hand domain-containing protein [Acidobacteriota bacterium]
MTLFAFFFFAFQQGPPPQDLDTDGDGKISQAEFLAHAQDRFNQMDQNTDGYLTEDERPAFGQRVHGPGPGGPGFMFLRQADADDNHEISQAEWAAMVSGLPHDGDGNIDVEALVASFLEDHPNAPQPPEGAPRLSEALDRNDDGLVNDTDFAQIFADLDADGNGTIQAQELPRPHRQGGERGGKGGPFFKTADSDQDGSITSDEWNSFVAGLPLKEDGSIDFAQIMAERQAERMGPGPRRGGPNGERNHGDRPQGNPLDADNNGLITPSDLQAFFTAHDQNNDGVLTQDEMGPPRMKRHR